MLKRVFLNVIQKPFQTCVLFFMVFLIGIIGCSGVTLYFAADSTRQETLRQLGAQLMLSGHTEAPTIEWTVGESLGSGISEDTVINIDDLPSKTYPVTEEMIQQIEALPHVQGCEMYLSTVVQPYNCQNVKKYSGYNPEEQNQTATFSEEEITQEKGALTLVGSTRIDLLDEFRRGQNVLTEGSLPSADNPGVLISEELAAQNGLSVGDSIEIAITQPRAQALHTQSKRQSLPVVGIYHTSLYFEVLETNSCGEAIFAASPYNAVFADYGSAFTTIGYTEETYTPSSTTVYVNSPTQLDSVAEQIKAIPIDWEHYTLFNMTQGIYEDSGAQLESISTTALRIVLFSLIAGGILLVLAVSIWNKSNTYETGLLIALGESKPRILLSQLLKVALIVLCAFAAACICSYFLTTFLAQNLEPEFISQSAETSVGAFEDGKMAIAQHLYIQPRPQAFLWMAGLGLLLILLAVSIPATIVMRLRPRSILDKAE